MFIDNMPGCCTSSILYSFGEHGERSVVNAEEIKKLVGTKMHVERDLAGHVVDGAKRCVFAISVDPKNIKMLREAGFKVVDVYDGIQGKVHILTLHL